MSEIDASVYVRAPQADVPATVALGVSLISAVPKGAPAPVKAAAKKLRSSVVELQKAWGTPPAAPPQVTKRAADAATDSAWGAMEARLSGYARLPVSRYPKAARALEIHGALFPTGLDFLAKAFKTQWAEEEKRLGLIDDKEYAADIDLLAGSEFLAEVRRAHKAYGKALAITQAEDPSPEATVLEPLRAVGRAVVDHALQLLAWASADPKAEASVRSALKPIDDLRATSARRAAGGPSDEPAPEPPATPTTPVPDVPA